MTPTHDALEEFRRRMKARAESAGGESGDFWSSFLGGEEGEGVIYDAEGNDRTALLMGMMEKIDQLTGEVVLLADRMKTLERLAVHDEQKLAEEIEKLRG
jgi:hypothetical protein